MDTILRAPMAAHHTHDHSALVDVLKKAGKEVLRVAALTGFVTLTYAAFFALNMRVFLS